MSELREAITAAKRPGELREALNAAKGGPRRPPVEVWLLEAKPGFRIACNVVHEDESADHPDIDSLSMRGAQREITSYLISQGYEPVGRWEVTARDGAGGTTESMRRFR